MNRAMDENILKSRARDLAEQCDRQKRVTQTGFLTPAELTVVRSAAVKSGIPFKAYGGYNDAERKILLFLPEYASVSEPDWGEYLKVLCISPSKEGLDHRDYLGAILALGIHRDQLGDILVSDKSAQIIVLSGIFGYLSLNMERVGSTRVQITSGTLSDLIIPESALLTIQGNVSSLRLDNVASEGFHMSRSEITDLIKSGQLNLNWVQELRPDHTLKPGDMVSLRGYGRIVLVSIDGRSRKDRYFITMEKTK